KGATPSLLPEQNSHTPFPEEATHVLDRHLALLPVGDAPGPRLRGASAARAGPSGASPAPAVAARGGPIPLLPGPVRGARPGPLHAGRPAGYHQGGVDSPLRRGGPRPPGAACRPGAVPRRPRQREPPVPRPVPRLPHVRQPGAVAVGGPGPPGAPPA